MERCHLFLPECKLTSAAVYKYELADVQNTRGTLRSHHWNKDHNRNAQLVFSTDFIRHKSLALIVRVAQTPVYDRKNTVVCRLARVSAPPFRASSDTWRDRRWRKHGFESSVEFVISDPGQLPYKTTRV